MRALANASGRLARRLGDRAGLGIAGQNVLCDRDFECGQATEAALAAQSRRGAHAKAAWRF